MRKSELTESHVQGADLDLEIQTQSTDVTTSIKKDIIGTNLVRNRYLPSWGSSSQSLSSSLDSSKVAESMPGPKPSSFIMPNLGSAHIVIHILHMTKVEVIKEDVATIKNKAPKQVKAMHLKTSLILLSEYKGWKVSLSKLPFTWGFLTMFYWVLNLDQAVSLRGLGLH